MRSLDAKRTGRPLLLTDRRSMGESQVTISPEQMSLLSEILKWEQIPEDQLVYFRERLRHRLHTAILDAFLLRAKERGLKQKDLADRIGRTRAQITRWLGTASNLTLDSISDLMAGLAMDFDAFPFTPIEKTIRSDQQVEDVRLEETTTKLITKVLAEWKANPPWARMVAEQERASGAARLLSPKPNVGGGSSAAKVIDLAQARKKPHQEETDEFQNILSKVGASR